MVSPLTSCWHGKQQEVLEIDKRYHGKMMRVKLGWNMLLLRVYLCGFFFNSHAIVIKYDKKVHR